MNFDAVAIFRAEEDISDAGSMEQSSSQSIRSAPAIVNRTADEDGEEGLAHRAVAFPPQDGSPRVEDTARKDAVALSQRRSKSRDLAIEQAGPEARVKARARTSPSRSSSSRDSKDATAVDPISAIVGPRVALTVEDIDLEKGISGLRSRMGTFLSGRSLRPTPDDDKERQIKDIVERPCKRFSHQKPRHGD